MFSKVFILKLYKLLRSPRIFMGSLKPESTIQRAFVQDLIGYTLEGNLSCVWCSIPNENSSNKNPAFGAMLRSLGKIKGAPDMVFLWKEGCGFLEFKAGKNRLTEEQKMFGEWCRNLEVNYEVVRSKEKAIEVLKEWGVLKCST